VISRPGLLRSRPSPRDVIPIHVPEQGLSPGVKFPRVLGIEAVGLVEEAPSGEFACGDIVATTMGAWGASLTVVMPNIRAFPRRKSKWLRPSCRGRRWALCRRCRRPRGLAVSVAGQSDPAYDTGGFDRHFDHRSSDRGYDTGGSDLARSQS